MAKQKVGTLAEQKLLECGRLARDLCNNSGSRDVLMKAAKKIATNEQSMESTLQVTLLPSHYIFKRHVNIDSETNGSSCGEDEFPITSSY